MAQGSIHGTKYGIAKGGLHEKERDTHLSSSDDLAGDLFTVFFAILVLPHGSSYVVDRIRRCMEQRWNNGLCRCDDIFHARILEYLNMHLLVDAKWHRTR